MQSQIRRHFVLLIALISFLGGCTLKKNTPATPVAQLPTNAHEIETRCESSLKKAKSQIESLIALPKDKRTFENTIAKVDDIYVTLDTLPSMAYLLKEVHPDQKIREAGEKCVLKAQEYSNSLFLRQDFYQAVKAYTPTDDLDSEDRKYYDDLLREFRRSGVHLPESTRKKLKAIRDEINQLTLSFSKNIAQDKTQLRFKKEDLPGFPERQLKELKKDGEMYILGMDYPTVTAVTRNVTREATRKKVIEAFKNRAHPANGKVLSQLIQKRDEMAKILGYKSYAAYQYDELMSKTPETVRAFLDDLASQVGKKAKKDFQAMVEAKRKYTGNPNAQLNSWDASFVRNLIKKEKYQLDEEKISEYFSVENVIEGLFEITSRLFEVDIREIPAPHKWHDTVKLYHVTDQSTGKTIGQFYTDLYPRENKYRHAAKFTLINGRKLPEGGYQSPVVAIVANFPQPTGDTPALLKHSNVETFFHEFGHVIHSIFTQAKYNSHAGTSVARDFVEAPSQMFENWVWKTESLKLFAKHYKTGKPLPDELLQSMIRAQKLNSGIHTQQQIFYSDISYTLYQEGTGKNISQTLQRLQKKHTFYPVMPNTHFEANFGHLSGYAAGYYGYQWSRVYAEDMFTRFGDKNLLNPKLGRELREKVLSKGSSRDEMESVVDFLGRQPNSKAFFQSLGI